MNISIDKDYTVVARLGQMKQAIKDFKATYTDGDLLREFNDQIGTDIGNEVIMVKGEAFHEIDGTPRFVFTMYTSDYGLHLYKVRFYCGEALDIETDPMLLDVEKFDKVREDR